jgi:hypothetical protein
MLAAAVDARHHHFEPWLAWREDRVIPFLAELSGARRDQFAALIARVLRRHLGPATIVTPSRPGNPRCRSTSGTA